MRISQKCYYALKAVLELARHGSASPLSIAAIGDSQAIPTQFLQVIMRELRQGGFVESRRGKEGGYLLTRDPASLTLGEIVRFLEGNFAPVECLAASNDGRCNKDPGCVFADVWGEIQQAVDSVVDGITIADLVERDQTKRGNFAPDYVI